MRKPVIACVLLAVAALAAGCGGGGGGGISPVPSGAAGANATGIVTIAVPAAPAPSSAKAPAYVSPNTQSISIVVTPQGGTAYPAVVANVPGTQCATAPGGGYVCTISVTASFGVDTLAITAYGGPNATGAVLSSGSITATFSPTAPPSPALNATLTGIVKKIGLSIVHGGVMDPYVPVGQSATLSVVGEDASGAAIVGAYDAPISIALPAGSGLSLGTTTFADSTHATSSISFAGGPTFYNAPRNAVTITATAAGGAVTQGIALDPTSTALAFPAGDGGTAAAAPRNMVRDGSALVFATTDGVAAGELVSVDPVTGVQSVKAPLAYRPNSVYVDPKFAGIWVSDNAGGAGILHCYTSPASADAPIPVPTAGVSNPDRMAADGQGHLWFASGSNLGRVTISGQCAGTGPAQFQNAPPSTNQPQLVDMVADSAAPRIWAGDAVNPDVYQSSAASFPTALALPFGGGVQTMTTDAAGNAVVISYGANAPYNGLPYLSTIAAGQTTFGSSYGLPGVSFPISSAASPSGQIAFGTQQYALVGLFDPANPTLATVLGTADPTANGAACAGVAFDASGEPWALCRIGSSTLLERFALTNFWAPFPALAHVYAGQATPVGIGGGATTLTFTATCTGSLTCSVVSGFPRLVTVTGSAVGTGTLTIGGSDGRSVVLPVAVQSPPPG